MLRVLRDRMCSNRWAKPERPSGSCFDPTSYQTETETLGVVVSRSAITRRPLASLRSANLIGGTTIRLDAAAGALPAWAAAGAAAPIRPIAPAASSSAFVLPMPILLSHLVFFDLC